MSLTIRSLNNASTLFEKDDDILLIDPWLLGDLYYKSWSPVKKLEDLSFLEKVKNVIITHLHEDHWDLDTLKLLKNDVNIYFPDLPMNGVISRDLKKINLEGNTIKIGEKFKISENFVGEFIEPLNGLALSNNYIKDYEIDATNIDTGILINERNSKTNHLVLCDNSPYDLKRLDRVIEKRPLTTFFYPFNGFAQDYPLCYQNLSTQEKKEISYDLSLKREDFLIHAIKHLRPEYVFPHSSDFLQNGPFSEVFTEIHPHEFLSRKAYSKRVQSLLDSIGIESKSDYLEMEDQATFRVDKSLKIDRDIFKSKTCSHKLDIDYPKNSFDKKFEIKDLLEESLKEMFKRTSRYKLNLSGLEDWVFEININQKETYYLDFELKKLVTKINNKKNILTLNTNKKIMLALLNRKMHWNNAQIGSFLSWKRNPDIFCDSLYKSLNFLHL